MLEVAVFFAVVLECHLTTLKSPPISHFGKQIDFITSSSTQKSPLLFLLAGPYTAVSHQLVLLISIE